MCLRELEVQWRDFAVREVAVDITLHAAHKDAVTRIRTGVAAATTQSTNHYTITAQLTSQVGVEPTIF